MCWVQCKYKIIGQKWKLCIIIHKKNFNRKNDTMQLQSSSKQYTLMHWFSPKMASKLWKINVLIFKFHTLSLTTHFVEEWILINPVLESVFCLHCTDVWFHCYLFPKVVSDPRAKFFTFLAPDWVTWQVVCELIIFTVDVLYSKIVAICAHHYVTYFVRDLVQRLVIINILQALVIHPYCEVQTAP